MPPVPAPMSGKAIERKPRPRASAMAFRTESRIERSGDRQRRLMPATWIMPRWGRRPELVRTAPPSAIGPFFASSRNGPRPPATSRFGTARPCRTQLQWLLAHITSSGAEYQPVRPDTSLCAQIPACAPRYQPVPSVGAARHAPGPLRCPVAGEPTEALLRASDNGLRCTRHSAPGEGIGRYSGHDHFRSS